jgi:hypothetical protein
VEIFLDYSNDIKLKISFPQNINKKASLFMGKYLGRGELFESAFNADFLKYPLYDYQINTRNCFIKKQQDLLPDKDCKKRSTDNKEELNFL